MILLPFEMAFQNRIPCFICNAALVPRAMVRLLREDGDILVELAKERRDQAGGLAVDINDVELGEPDKNAQSRPLLPRRPASTQGNGNTGQGNRPQATQAQGDRNVQGLQNRNAQVNPNGTQGHVTVRGIPMIPLPAERPALSIIIPPPPRASESQASTPTPTPQTETATSVQKKWRRSDRRHRRLNTELLEAIENHNIEELERLLQNGANPNATCRLGLVSACHMAALFGGDAMALLLRHGAEKHRLDKLGRTPLHLAAYAGNSRQIAVMLDFPEDMQLRVESDMSSGTEEDVKQLCQVTRQLVNVRCDLEELHTLVPKSWKDNIDHDCKDIQGSLPLFQPGWTPLHIASSCGRRHCARLLLAAGADPNICDVMGRTALDVAGSACYFDKDVKEDHFVDVLKMLLKAKGQFYTMRKEKGVTNIDTPLHTAVLLDSKEAIELLLDAGAQVSCLNSSGLTPLHLCVKKEAEAALQVLANYDYKYTDPLSAVVDVKDRDGHTVLQAAIEAEWVPGVCVALEAGADVTLKANDGETPVHSAAAIGNIEVLSEILSLAKQSKFIDCKNEEGETPLFKAITNGHVACVRALLKEGASIHTTLPGDINVLHVAADYGHLDILKCLLEYDKTYEMLNALSAADRRGMGPIHFAASGNHHECVKFLLEKDADIRLRTTNSPHKSSTPLHIAAAKNHSEVAKVILSVDKTTIHEVNSMGWFPLHTASHHSSREVIFLLLKDGANLSGYTDGPKKFRRTAIDMVLNNLGKPTEFLEEVLDSYITSSGLNQQETDCVVTVDYSVLIPNVCEMEQMKVIEALLKTGNRYGQRRLLIHPLVESFLFLKWKVLLPFFYTIIAFYAFFVFSLSTFVVSVFWFKDTEREAPEWLHPHIWGYIVYVAVCLVLIQELLYMNVKSSRYFLQLETWVKFGSIGLATLLPPAFIITSWSEGDWSRHVSTVALLLAWLEMMFLLSRFPNWGYYVLMFGKVASNIVKILLTFGFLVVGFALSFMIQFRSTEPFDGPWSALVKTMVMMTSEFEYESLFDDDHAKTLSNSISIVRFMFVLFMILAAIVLMNLMVGVAVNDINDLEILGNINRLAKQVEFLGTLDVLVYNKFFQTILPKRMNNHIKNRRKVLTTLCLSPGKPRWRHFKQLPSRIRDAILDRAQAQEKQKEVETDFKLFRQKMDEMHKVLIKKEDKKETLAIEVKPVLVKQKIDEITKHLKNLDDDVTSVKDQMVEHEKTQDSLSELNVKMDQMSLDIENIKQFLLRLESKLG